MDFRRNFHAIKIFIFKLSLKKVLSSLTHPHEILNMHDSSVEHESRYSEECWQPNSFGDHWLAMYDEKKNISNTFLYSAEEMINDDRIFIFVGTLPLKQTAIR